MEKSKGSKIVLIVIILLLLILMVAGGAYAYIATDLFKSEEQLFKKYLVNGVLEVSKFNTEPYGEAFKRMENEPAEISATTKTKNESYFEDYEEQEMKLTLKTDIPNRNEALSINVKRDGENYAKADFLITDNIYGIYVDGLHDKYIAIENRDLKKIAKNLGAENNIVEMIPDSISETGLSKEEQKKLVEILTKYANKIAEQIDKNAYTEEKYVIEDFDGEKFEGNKYTLDIQLEKYMNSFSNTLKEIQKDEELYKIFEEKISDNTLQLIKEYDLDEALDIENYKSDNEDEVTEDNNIKISLYAYKGKTIKLELYTTKELVFEMYTVNKDNSSHIQTRTYSPKTKINEVAFAEIVNLRNTFENNVGEMIIETETQYNKDDIKELNSKIDTYRDEDWYKEREEASKNSVKLSSNIENDVITSKVSVKSSEETMDVSATYTMKFGSDIKVPTLKKDNMIIVNDYTEEDFSKLGEEITENVEKTAEENPNSLIGSMFSSRQYNTLDMSEDDWNYSGDLTNDITTTDYSVDIDYEKEFISSTIKYTIDKLLEDYKIDLENDPNTNLGDYLTGDKIEDGVSMFFIDNLEVIDGETLKTTYNDKTFFTKIFIDGDSLTLEDIETLYSEDGTLENAE